MCYQGNTLEHDKHKNENGRVFHAKGRDFLEEKKGKDFPKVQNRRDFCQTEIKLQTTNVKNNNQIQCKLQVASTNDTKNDDYFYTPMPKTTNVSEKQTGLQHQ